MSLENVNITPATLSSLEPIPSEESLNSKISISPTQESKPLIPQQPAEDDVSKSEQVSSDLSTPNEDKPRRKRSSFKHQLVVDNVYLDGTVECRLLCKQKTVSFKFNRLDTKPADIIESLVKQEVLKEGSHKHLRERFEEVLARLQAEPDKVPECAKEKPVVYVQKVCLVAETVKYKINLVWRLAKNIF